MTLKKYRLVPGIAAPFLRGGDFQFKLAYQWPHESGGTIYRGQGDAPTITLGSAPPGIVQCDNDHAQACIERFIAPQGTERNGQKHPEGNLFAEYVGPLAADVDLDAVFAAHEAGS